MASRQLEDRGVTDVILGFRNPTSSRSIRRPLQQKVDLLLRMYADDVIAKVGRPLADS